MKTEPTDLDREAARLFTPARGMFAWTDLMGPGFPPFCGTVLGVAGEGFARVIADDGPMHSRGRVVAIDADDDATVGVMEPQVFAMRPGRPMYIRPAADPQDDGCDIGPMEWWEVVDMGRELWPRKPTRGAALVAAMRALKGKP